MMALEVEDMDKALAHLRARGVEPVWGPISRASYARAEIRDPDGNHIELRQWKQPAQAPAPAFSRASSIRRKR